MALIPGVILIAAGAYLIFGQPPPQQLPQQIPKPQKPKKKSKVRFEDSSSESESSSDSSASDTDSEFDGNLSEPDQSKEINIPEEKSEA